MDRNKAPLKTIVFHSSFEEQQLYSQQSSIMMTESERLMEMYRLNHKIYGSDYGKLSKKTELYSGRPGETIEDFYERINNNE